MSNILNYNELARLYFKDRGEDNPSKGKINSRARIIRKRLKNKNVKTQQEVMLHLSPLLEVGELKMILDHYKKFATKIFTKEDFAILKLRNEKMNNLHFPIVKGIYGDDELGQRVHSLSPFETYFLHLLIPHM